MNTILITGATGNVGIEIIKNISQLNKGDVRVIAGVRDSNSENKILDENGIEKISFDFEDPLIIARAFEACNILFLLRPPHISNVKKFFQPIIEIAIEKKIDHIVFLSVQGAETSSFIPHYKIEKLIEKSGINYTFLRPAYFMQNFTTTLRQDLLKNQRIYLPAGKSKFTLIDVEDVGKVAAVILLDPTKHQNKAYELTNKEQMSFGEMAAVLTEVLDKKITFVNPDLISFYINKRKEEVPSMFILVMIMLHYLPRFKATPKTANWVETISGKSPVSFRGFVVKNQHLLTAKYPTI